MLLYLINFIYKYLNKKKFNNFVADSTDLEQTQRGRLAQMLPELGVSELSYSDFINKYPVTTYEDWRQKIDQQKSTGEPLVCPEVVRYQPTSGSSGAQKWIPYTQGLLNEFDAAASPWVYDMFCKYPGVMKGAHYWSLSWLPTKDRSEMGVIDDGELFSFWKKFFINKIFAVPKDVALLESSQDSMLATAVFLVSKPNLSLISVWSPSFLISIIDIIFEHKINIIESLNTGSWQPLGIKTHKLKSPKNKKAAKLLQTLTKGNQVSVFESLWPKLSLVSCWDTGLAHSSFMQLKSIFPNIDFQGKGLWSTEAVVTIPFKSRFTLSYQSHFYEFKNIETEEVVPSWQLKPGMKVMPIMTTGSGLLRYLIKDVLVVDGLWSSIPCLTFQGRAGHSDLVGEKLDHSSISELIKTLNQKSDRYNIICLLACNYSGLKKPYYCLYVESDDSEIAKAINFEDELLNYFHYRLAREVGQLDPCQVVINTNASNLYYDHKESEGMIKGNIKVEAISLVSTIKSKEILF